ncbi:MAG: response regulator transcription factor [Alphaproteobacteria bacterium]|jgi:DNA-binding NarL/FixJ family response regulator|nr:response regulator transcription factor [Alphaproteobacteria bacterium]MDP6568020.1 response regulator transcription factor [Alphaproteobacteria bacterium]MDP6813487.1 response regulator transcription factor [Alphaproteobacteria bacterium]
MLRTLADEVEMVEAAIVEEALASIEAHPEFDLILLDYILPGTNGVKEISRIQRAWRSAPIVIVSGTATDWDMAQSFRRGVMGFIPKTYSSDEMLAGLRKVLEGERYIPPADANRVVSALVDGDEPAHITDRQKDILRLLAEGLTNKGIANRLEISQNTVRTHLTQVFRTLGVSTRTEAIFAAHREGIIDAP